MQEKTSTDLVFWQTAETTTHDISELAGKKAKKTRDEMTRFTYNYNKWKRPNPIVLQLCAPEFDCDADGGSYSSAIIHQDLHIGLDTKLDTSLKNNQYKLPPLISNRLVPDTQHLHWRMGHSVNPYKGLATLNRPAKWQFTWPHTSKPRTTIFHFCSLVPDCQAWQSTLIPSYIVPSLFSTWS